MAETWRGVTFRQLAWVHDWNIREEAYAGALARLIEAHRALPIARIRGDGSTSSSDGQYFRAGSQGAAIGDINARHGNEPGVAFYTHVSDQFSPFHTKVIAATASEAPHVFDGLLYHQTGLQIVEHYTDTAVLPTTFLASATCSGFASRLGYATSRIDGCICYRAWLQIPSSRHWSVERSTSPMWKPTGKSCSGL
jgi:TnpA family transposase